MNAVYLAFASVLELSLKASCLIALLLVFRRVAGRFVPAKIFFWLWLGVAVRLLLPVSIPVSWAPLNWLRLTTPISGHDVQPLADPGVAVDGGLPLGGDLRLHKPAAGSRYSWQQVVALLWASGVALLLARRLAAGIALRRKLHRTSTPLSSDDLPADGWGKLTAVRIRAFVTDAVSSPALVGLVRPQILFPVGFAQAVSADELRLIVAHELAHARRRDLLADAVLQLARTVHWFNPLVWFAVQTARRDCELACDEAVMREATATESDRYARLLLKIASFTRTPASQVGLGVMTSKREIKRRIEMIVTRHRFSAQRTLLVVSVFIALVAFSFTTETTAQVPVPTAPASGRLPVEPAQSVAESSGVVYNSAIDRLDDLFPSGAVATVGDRTITVADVRQYVAPLISRLQSGSRTQEEFNAKLALLQNSAIKDLVNRVVLIRQFRDQKPGEEPKQIAADSVDRYVADIIAERFQGDRAKFLDYLRSRSLTQRQYRQELEEDIIYNYMRAQERKLTGKTPAAPKSESAEKPIRLRLIQLSRAAAESDASLLRRAEQVLTRFRSGERFDELAAEFDESGRKAQKGDWGWIGREDLRPDFQPTVMALRKGEVSAPLVTPDGCFLLYIDDRR